MINGLAPYLWVVLAAAIVFLPGLMMLFGRGGPRDAAGRKTFRFRPIRRFIGLLLLALGGVCLLLALSIFQFLRLTDDAPVAQIVLKEDGPQRYTMTATVPHVGARDYAIAGDQWQIEGRVLRWRLPALMAGLPPLYRLERVSGRYSDIEQERTGTRTVYPLDDWTVPDLGTLRRRFPNWLPFVDVVFGSGAYMPMFDGARYQVFMDPRGALFVRPADDATKFRLVQHGF
ncbi:hypothetical protein [Schauerella aestuarii]|uniref:hypothetical protein n=1 Tax=Schauerella aestuarii TaxID=2511204 RepID=UPI00136A6D28|nr:hypothetical protein [Achromobacter aestuarii]MYZ42222.1 hypothetical protein [Achromobacter aestuarii]